MFLRLVSLICWCCCLGALAAGMLGLAAFVGPDYWLSDNMSFFLMQYLAAGLAGCVVGLLGMFLRHHFVLLYRTLWSLGFIALVTLAGLTGSRTLAHTRDPAPVTAEQQKIKVVSINIEHLFLGDRVLQEFLEKEKPDILVLQETLWGLQQRRWEKLGEPTGSRGVHGFPEYLEVGDLGGVVVYSRFPVLGRDSHLVQGVLPHGSSVYYDADREILSLTLDTGETPLHLLAIHPDSPRNHDRWIGKRAYMDEVDKVVGELQARNAENILAIGDWNSSPWSGRFQQTLERYALGTAYPDGWPQNTRFFFDYRLRWILGAPVDQFTLSEDVHVASVALGPDIGSDHVPLIVEIGLRSEKPGTPDG